MAAKYYLRLEGRSKFTHKYFINACLLGFITTVLLFGASCGKIISGISGGSSRTSTNSNSNTESSNTVNSSSSSSSFDSAKYQELLNKANEIRDTSLPLKPDPKAVIKGKVLLVKNLEAGSGKYDQGISDFRRASNLAELESVIRIMCSKGKFLGDFREVSYDARQTAKAYGINCQVSLIDYSSKTIVAQKSFSNNEKVEVISDKEVRSGEFINAPPVGVMVGYINNFQVDKVMPAMTRLDEKELVRLPTTISLKPEAALKGKIKIVQKYEKGAPEATLNSFIEGSENYNFPYERIAQKPEELETLVKVTCVKGSPIGKIGKVPQFSSKCEVSLIDYKTLSVMAQKTFENKTLDENASNISDTFTGWIVDLPKQEIESYLKSFPN